MYGIVSTIDWLPESSRVWLADADFTLSTSSSLAIVPLFRCPGYSATKAALHSMILSMRNQLQDTKVKFVEIFPPAVQS